MSRIRHRCTTQWLSGILLAACAVLAGACGNGAIPEKDSTSRPRLELELEPLRKTGGQVRVAVSREGSYEVRGVECGPARIHAALRVAVEECRGRNEGECRVVLDCDREAPWTHVSAILWSCGSPEIGVTDVVFACEVRTAESGGEFRWFVPRPEPEASDQSHAYKEVGATPLVLSRIRVRSPEEGIRGLRDLLGGLEGSSGPKLGVLVVDVGTGVESVLRCAAELAAAGVPLVYSVGAQKVAAAQGASAFVVREEECLGGLRVGSVQAAGVGTVAGFTTPWIRPQALLECIWRLTKARGWSGFRLGGREEASPTDSAGDE